jgi:NADH:ubiquinone oxidoreductase subunit E/NAD-dependent dihydropyrimidine dehydrogenase PreA subunit
MSQKNGSERIGVYVCHCGTNISHTVDVKDVVEYARKLPGVVKVREYKYMCSDPGQDIIKQDIIEDKLTRVVVASCSPLMHEETFRSACESAGLNRFLFQMANIREQCSWVHLDRSQATAKAKRLVAGAVRRVSYHESLEEREAPVNPNTLVVGAGIAGIEAALKIADSGKKVYLVEKESSIGGHMAKFDKTFPTLDCAACILTPKMVQVGQHPNIEMMTYSEVEELSGYIGNFKAKIRRKARFVDEEKCTGCSQCVERCPVHFKPTDGKELAPEYDLEPAFRIVVDRAIDLHSHERGPLVTVLQDINTELGYIPPETLKYISAKLQTPLADVYHVATFYTAFSLTPRGEHTIKVCMGTACHVRGAARVLETLEDRLQIKAGSTSEDMKYTLETVNCLGACALAPVVTVDADYHGKVTPGKIDKLIESCEKGIDSEVAMKG